MKLKIRLRVLISLLIVSFALPVYSESQYWWGRGDEGWFFYKDPPKEEEREEKKEERRPEVKLEAPSSEPQFLFTERMKRRGEELLSGALEEPTIENVKAYMEYNAAMMRLSEKFSLAWQRALMAYPEFESPVPVSDVDKDLYFGAVKEKEKEILEKLSREAGLFFFYSTSCPFCERQALHLRRFMAEHPCFVVKPVSLDGGVLSEFPETLIDNGISQRLGVDAVPSIFLAFPPERFERISSGILTADELKRRLIWYAKEIGAPYSNSSSNP